jgi:hypothetical protein
VQRDWVRHRLPPGFKSFGWLVREPMRSQQHPAAGLKRENANLARVPQNPDRPVPGKLRALLNQPLNDTPSEQHGVDVVGQRRAVVAIAVNSVDRIADVKSIKGHGILMPKAPDRRLDIDQICGSFGSERGPPADFGRVSLPSRTPASRGCRNSATEACAPALGTRQGNGRGPHASPSARP